MKADWMVVTMGKISAVEEVGMKAVMRAVLKAAWLAVWRVASTDV